MGKIQIAVKIFFAIFVVGVKGERVCYGSLGCFTNDPPFSSPLLSEPLLPESRDVIDVTYALYLRHNPKITSQNAAFRSVNISGPHTLSYNEKPNRKWRQLLTATKRTKIILHDYDDTSSNAWVFAMVERFLQREDCHVIAVGYRSPDVVGGYYQAAANARVVGAEITHLLKNIKAWKSEFEFESVHLIGHGLGAHAASYVGESLKIDDTDCLTQQSREGDSAEDDDSGSWWQLPSWLRSKPRRKEKPSKRECPKIPVIGQITGLDPSGLWFENAQVGARLDPSDAIFVDVIHTDVLKQLTSYFGHGIVRTSGNVDFYPNGGYDQPGCSDDVTGFEDLNYPDTERPRRPMDCNHLRSIVYYLSSMTPGSCPMTSFPCGGWNVFNYAQCTSCIDDINEVLGYSSSWWSYLGFGNRRRRTSGPQCLKLGPTAVAFWREHKKRAKAAKSDVTNIKAFLKTAPRAPYCLKYIRVELELMEPSSAGTLSFRFSDQTNERTDLENVGRVSTWGSTEKPTYLVTVPNTFRRVSKVSVLWEVGNTTSWWPGFLSQLNHASSSRKELKLHLRRIKLTQPPLNEISYFCSARNKLLSGRENRFARCGAEMSYDYAHYPGQ